VIRLNPDNEADERENQENADRMLAIQLSDFGEHAFG